MKKLVKNLLKVFFVLSLVGSLAYAAGGDEKDIRAVINSYKEALKNANSSKVVQNFSTNAVLMPPNAPTAKGSDEIKAVYDGLFKILKLDISFSIDEVVVNGDYAFVRSTSKGTATLLENNAKADEINRELFIFQRQDNKWKIAYYMYNKMS